MPMSHMKMTGALNVSTEIELDTTPNALPHPQALFGNQQHKRFNQKRIENSGRGHIEIEFQVVLHLQYIHGALLLFCFPLEMLHAESNKRWPACIGLFSQAFTSIQNEE